MLIVLFSCSSLIIINYLTIKTLSACRAYIDGESHYSKAQKDATLHLITYLYSENKNEWSLFNQELVIPEGDKIARFTLENGGSIDTIEAGFKTGRNNPKDIDDLIWLYKNFQSISFFRDAIIQWEAADQLVDNLAELGNEVNQKIVANNLSEEEKSILLVKINLLSVELSKYGNKFAETLAEGSRDAKKYLLLLNVMFTLIIIGSVSVYYLRMLKKLNHSKLKTDATNLELLIVNKELDKFVYSASHDLRSPISSLKGLIEVMKSEDDLEQIKSYLTLMDGSLDKQDQFIKDIIDYSRNKKSEISIENVSLKTVVETSISQNKYLQESKNINVYTNLTIDLMNSNALKLNIIINNLYTNGIKYYDATKERPSIAINAFEEDDSYILVIEDNGIGIKPEFHSKIFEMFFVTNNESKGSGLGLYLVKDAIEKLKGTIKIKSKIGVGTQFIISLPKNYNEQS
ncbi:sensor histidine kinase [Flavobacterium sp. SM2513]|uniref:sensor histidine kinase n=1 Tax=Flavobacterium sp. SM2513 TaxID=3424766 RepID=UPI003D7F681A